MRAGGRWLQVRELEGQWRQFPTECASIISTCFIPIQNSTLRKVFNLLYLVWFSCPAICYTFISSLICFPSLKKVYFLTFNLLIYFYSLTQCQQIITISTFSSSLLVLFLFFDRAAWKLKPNCPKRLCSVWQRNLMLSVLFKHIRLDCVFLYFNPIDSFSSIQTQSLSVMSVHGCFFYSEEFPWILSAEGLFHWDNK